VDTLENAKKRSEFWKAEHIAANVEIERLRGKLEQADSQRETIGRLLADAMDVAVSNGADSRSMPDEYVSLAVWLCDT